MSKRVTIKSESGGLMLLFQEEMNMKEIYSSLDALIERAGDFFKNSKVNIYYTGLRLTPEEEQNVLLYFREISNADIRCFISKQQDEIKETDESEEKNKNEAQNSDFYKGTLRSGQIVRSDGNLVVIGDVNPGAEVVAEGSIVVMGSLRGRANAGIKKSENAFVVALNLEPMVLQIGDFIARSPDEHEYSKEIKPEIAYIRDGKMIIEGVKLP